MESTAAAPPRKQFRLDGPSIALEPGRYAVRRDLAEIAVADRVFAQHYAQPMGAGVRHVAAIHERPDTTSAVIATLAAGEIFCLLDLGEPWAWGRTDRAGTTGYVQTSGLDLP